MGEDDVGGAPSVASPGPDAARNERLVRVVWVGVVLVLGGLGVAGARAGDGHGDPLKRNSRTGMPRINGTNQPCSFLAVSAIWRPW